VGKVRSVSALLLILAGVLLWVGIPALAATPKVGKWQGTVSIEGAGVIQQVTVKFSTVRTNNGGRRVKGFSLGRLKAVECTGGADSYATSGFKTTVKPKVIDGAFKFKETIGGTTLKGAGRFTKKTRAKGTVTLTASKAGATCTTGKSNWKAKLAG
jgi:hypothetical protein